MESNKEMTITLNLEEYRELLDLKTRVDVMVAMYRHESYFNIEDALAVLGVTDPRKGEE